MLMMIGVAITNPSEEIEGEKPIAFFTIYFDTAKAELKYKAYKTLHKAAQVIKSYPEAKIILEGHADSRPICTPKFPSNMELSMARSKAVLDYFVKRKNIPKERFKTFNYGETKPIATNETSEGQSLNRRVEIILLDLTEIKDNLIIH
jgi:chemotaxis protein MotB